MPLTRLLRARLRAVAAPVLMLVLLAPPAAAQVLLVPPNLPPGATYRLIYVTSATRNAIPVDITIYDAFVQAQSDGSDIGTASPIGDITWKAIGSTEFVDARDHVDAAGPLYRLDGVFVSNDASALWDGSIDNPINVDDEGLNREVFVYTGTDSLGFAAFAGAAPVRLGDSSARLGDSGEFDQDWVETIFFSSSAIGRAFYAISDPLTVPLPPPAAAPTLPLPSAALFAGLLVAALVAVRRRRVAAFRG